MESRLLVRTIARPSKILKRRPLLHGRRYLAGQPDHHDSPSHSRPFALQNISNALRDVKAADNSLLARVHIADDPHGVLTPQHPAAGILGHSAVVVQRELEMMNLLVGVAQVHRYVIMDPRGNHLGYIAEQEKGMTNVIARQMFRTHRSFTTHIFDRERKEVLRFHRPFSWISSRIHVYDPLDVATSARPASTSLQKHGAHASTLSTSLADGGAQTSPFNLSQMRIIGEAQQQWAPLRRKYNLFTAHAADAGALDQFAYVDEPFLSWDFALRGVEGQRLGAVNRDFAGFGREIFTDTGVYALRMDAAEEGAAKAQSVGKSSGMSLDQRAVMLATAVSIDFDYFTRQRGSFMGGMFPWWFAGGEAAEGAAGAGAAGAAGAEGTGAEAAGAASGAAGAAGIEIGSTAAGGVARGASGGVAGAGEGAMAGAGTMAGYEAMQRGLYGERGADSPRQDEVGAEPAQQQPQQGQPEEGLQGGDEEVWGEKSPWDRGQDGSSGDGGGGGDGGGFDIEDWL